MLQLTEETAPKANAARQTAKLAAIAARLSYSKGEATKEFVRDTAKLYSMLAARCNVFAKPALKSPPLQQDPDLAAYKQMDHSTKSTPQFSQQKADTLAARAAANASVQKADAARKKRAKAQVAQQQADDYLAMKQARLYNGARAAIPTISNHGARAVIPPGNNHGASAAPAPCADLSHLHRSPAPPNSATSIDNFSAQMMELIDFSTKPTTKALLASFKRALATMNIPATAMGPGDKVNGTGFNEGELVHLALELWSVTDLNACSDLASFAGTHRFAELKHVTLVPFSQTDATHVNRILGPDPTATMLNQFAAEASAPATPPAGSHAEDPLVDRNAYAHDAGDLSDNYLTPSREPRLPDDPRPLASLPSTGQLGQTAPTPLAVPPPHASLPLTSLWDLPPATAAPRAYVHPSSKAVADMQKTSQAQRALTARLNDLQAQLPLLMSQQHPHGWGDIRRANPMLFPAVTAHLQDQQRIVDLWRAAGKQDDNQNIAAGRPISAFSAAISPSSFDRTCAAMVQMKNLSYRGGNNTAPAFDELYAVPSQGQLCTAIATYHFTGRGSSMVANMRAALASLSFLDHSGRLAVSQPLATLTHAVGTAVESGASVDARHIMVSVEAALARSSDNDFYAGRKSQPPLIWSVFCNQQLTIGTSRGPVPPVLSDVYNLLDSLTEFAVIQSARSAAYHEALAAESLSSGTPLLQPPVRQTGFAVQPGFGLDNSPAWFSDFTQNVQSDDSDKDDSESGAGSDSSELDEQSDTENSHEDDTKTMRRTTSAAPAATPQTNVYPSLLPQNYLLTWMWTETAC